MVGGKKYNSSLKKLLQQYISEPEFYVDLIYKLIENVGKFNISEQFISSLTVKKNRI